MEGVRTLPGVETAVSLLVFFGYLLFRLRRVLGDPRAIFAFAVIVSMAFVVGTILKTLVGVLLVLTGDLQTLSLVVLNSPYAWTKSPLAFLYTYIYIVVLDVLSSVTFGVFYTQKREEIEELLRNEPLKILTRSAVITFLGFVVDVIFVGRM